MDSAVRTQSNDVDFFIEPGMDSRVLDKFDAVRRFDPIFWSEKNNAWLITGHKQVAEGYFGRLPLSAVRLPNLVVQHIPQIERERSLSNLMNVPKTFIINMDDPEHQRLRKLVSKAFSRQVVETIQPHVKRFVQDALDAVSLGTEFDFVSKVARLIPARMILRQFGLPDTAVEKLHRWSVVLGYLGNINMPLADLREVDAVLAEMREFFSPEIEKRRRSPTDDFLSALVTANEDGDRLSDEEMFGVCVITLVAGQDTTANTMAMVVDMLAKDRDALSALRAMEAIDANTIMELQRRAAMSTNMARIVAEDFEWEGHHLRKGEFVLLIQAAANHDPSIFPDPEKIDFTRKQTQNMTFAPGVHHCIGHLVAKMILTEFFEVFLRRFDFEIPDHRREYSPGMSFRGLEALPIVLAER